MNLTTPRLDTAHPPCPEPSAPRHPSTRTIHLPTDTARLALADRLSLRLGLWLLLRAQRAPQRTPVRRLPTPGLFDARPTTEHEAITLASYQLQRQAR